MPANRQHRKLFSPFLLLLLGAVTMSSSARAEGWMWSFTPYLWASGVNFEVSVDDRQVAESKTTFSDLAGGIDFAAQGHFEAQYERNGFYVDGTYLNLGDDSKTFTIASTGRELEVKGDLEQTMVDIAGLYNPSANGQGFSVIYGARLLYVTQTLRLDFTSPLVTDRRYDFSSTLWDGMVGFRYVAPISDRWLFLVRGSVSSGGTEFTWDGMGAIGYTFGAQGRYTLLGGYRYMELNFKDSGDLAKLETKEKMSGFIGGLTIRW